MHTTLISAQTLRLYLEDANWIIFDVRHELADTHAGRNAYSQGHIPGAIFLHMDEDLSGVKTGLNGRHPLPERTPFAARLAALGVSAHSQVVIYDAHGGMMAARLWWMLRWLGHEAVAVLDAGLPAWLAEDGALEVSPAAPRPAGNLSAGIARTELVSCADLLANLDSARQILIDARGPDRFRGENETLDPVGGHIPGARNRFFRDNLQANNQFKPAEILRQEFESVLQTYQAGESIAQCGSGVSACHNLLAMEIAGLSGAKLYAGSWSEWCSDPSRPVAQTT